MRSSSLSLALFAISCSFGCSVDDSGTSATSLTTGPSTNGSADGTDTTGTTTTDGTDTTADGPETTGDGDGDGNGDGYCAHQCTSDADCQINGMSVDLTCVDNVCTSADPGCTDDDECVALYSGWTTPCTAGGGECDGLGQICLGNNLCATPPSDFIDCAALGMEEVNAIDIDLNPVVVCGQPTAICNDDAFCFLPCASDDDCLSDAYPSCDVGSGLCQCGSDADCATLNLPQGSACNAGYCGCGSDQDCIDGNVGDVCTGAGYCGCSGDMACANLANPFDGGMYACVQP
jgi:hypothetical protein